MQLRPLLAVVLTAFFTLSAAQAQVYTCTFKNGTSVKIDDHYDGDLRKRNHHDIDYIHYDPAGKADLTLKAVAIGWVNQAHTITEYYRFQNRDHNYIAIHDGLAGFDGLKVYQGQTLINAQACTGDGWSPAIDPSSSTLPDDTDGPFADTFMQ